MTLTTLPIRVYFAIARLTLDTVFLYTKFDDSSSSHSIEIWLLPQKRNGSRDLTMPLWGLVCHQWLGIATINPPTKLEVFICTITKIWKAIKMRKWVVWVLMITQGHSMQRIRVPNFLLAFHNNYVQSPILTHQLVIGVPVWGDHIGVLPRSLAS